MSMKIAVNLYDDSLDTMAKMLIGYVLRMDKESEPNYNAKVEVVVEFMEEVMDTSFQSVATYLTVLMLMPETIKRRIPFRIAEFINMYQERIEEVLGGPIPSKYAPKRIITEEKKLLGPDGNPVDKPKPKLELL